MVEAFLFCSLQINFLHCHKIEIILDGYFFIQLQFFSSWWSLVAVLLFDSSWGAKWAGQIINAGEKTLQTTYLSAHVDLTMFLLQSWNPALTGTPLKKRESAAYSQINLHWKTFTTNNSSELCCFSVFLSWRC